MKNTFPLPVLRGQYRTLLCCSPAASRPVSPLHLTGEEKAELWMLYRPSAFQQHNCTANGFHAA